MYARVEQIRAFSAHCSPSEQRPGILCEYAHSMGNSTGGFAQYWDAFEELDGIQARSTPPHNNQPISALFCNAFRLSAMT